MLIQPIIGALATDWSPYLNVMFRFLKPFYRFYSQHCRMAFLALCCAFIAHVRLGDSGFTSISGILKAEFPGTVRALARGRHMRSPIAIWWYGAIRSRC